MALNVLQSRGRATEAREDIHLRLTWYTPANGIIRSPFELKYIGMAAYCDEKNCLLDPIADTARLTNLYSRFGPEASDGFLSLSGRLSPEMG